TWSCAQATIAATSHATNTAALLRRLDRWRAADEHREIAVVTFNYDTLLEDAAQATLLLEFGSLSNYVDATRKWQFFKLHGSANWAQEIDRGLDPTIQANPGEIIRAAEKITLSSAYR